MVFPDLLTANELLEDRLPVCDKVKNLLGIKSLWFHGVTGASKVPKLLEHVEHVTSCDRFHVTKQGVLNAFVSNESC